VFNFQFFNEKIHENDMAIKNRIGKKSSFFGSLRKYDISIIISYV